MKKIRRSLRNAISTSPGLYCFVASRGRNGFRVVTPEKDLVIEGYPRSGNSYVEAAFLCSQRPDIRLAHHTHAAANVLRAVQLGKPCYVLLRAPAEAAISLVLQEPDTHDLNLSLSEYLIFHEGIEPVADRICLVPFEIATRSFNLSIDHLNSIYGSDFAKLDEGLTREKIMERVDEVSRSRATVPDGVEPYSPFADEAVKAHRREQQEALRRALETPELAEKLRRCQALYERLRARTALTAMIDKVA